MEFQENKPGTCFMDTVKIDNPGELASDLYYEHIDAVYKGKASRKLIYAVMAVLCVGGLLLAFFLIYGRKSGMFQGGSGDQPQSVMLAVLMAFPILIGVSLLIGSIRGLLTNGGCSETVLARCIGYQYTYQISEHVSTHRRYYYLIGTPVFEYNYSGRAIRATDGNDYQSFKHFPACGSMLEIKVNPTHPTNLQWDVKKRHYKTVLLCTCFWLLFWGIFLGIFIVKSKDGFGTGNKAEKGKYTEDGLLRITDEELGKLAEKYSDDGGYYVVVRTVTDIVDEPDSFVLYFEPIDGMKSGIQLKDLRDQYQNARIGDRYYWVDFDTASTLYDVDDYSYTGNHLITIQGNEVL